MRSRRVKIVFLTIFGTILSVVASELALRIAGPSWLRERMDRLAAGGTDTAIDASNSDRDWNVVTNEDGVVVRFERNSRFLVRNNEYQHWANISSVGHRVVANGPSDPKGQVPFVGDSFVFGVGVEDEETFASHLSRPSSFSILNAGIPGSSLGPQLAQVRALYKEWGEPSKILFFVYLGNDSVDAVGWRRKLALREIQADGATSPPSPPRTAWLPWFNSLLHVEPMRSSYVIWAAKISLLRLRNNEAAAGSLDARIQGSLIARRRDQEEAFAHLVREYRALEDELGFDGMFILIPPKIYLDNDERRFWMSYYSLGPEKLDFEQPRLIVSRALRESGVEFFDPSMEMEKVYNAQLYYRDDDHFTSLGHRVFASLIAPAVESWLSR